MISKTQSIVYAVDEKRQAKLILQNMFTPDFVSNFHALLIHKFMILAKEDLELWESDPETFVITDEADHWEYSIRVRNHPPSL